ncbi:MAG: choice-of-anchor tandem repeat GloVer-containing protein [Candidatus Korobacteraceae bacterium]
MQTSNWTPFGTRVLFRTLLIILAFCVGAAIPSPAQTLTTLTVFVYSNGSVPFWPLTQGSDGYLYGTTSRGGNSGSGVIFKMTTGIFIPLYSFSGPDGQSPEALVEATDGNFYGMTYDGGLKNDGTVFKITSSGTLTTLYNFTGADGMIPNGGLVQATDGNLYGTTALGGANGSGTLFKIAPSGRLTTLYNFCSRPICADGDGPIGVLVQGTDKNLYGTTVGGGENLGYGTIFKITPAGVLTTLHDFTEADGSVPSNGLVQATDGNFYGTTAYGGPNTTCPNSDLNTCGTIFKITPSGALTMLYNFAGTDGATPQSALIQATDGNFYGTTTYGGNNNEGTAFKITPGGTLTTLYSFCSEANCPDGEQPVGGLVQANNGQLFGTTSGGGELGCNSPYGCGTVFELSGLNPTSTEFVPVTPCRLADTRQGSPIQGGTWDVFVVPQLGGCNIPSTATAYSLNVTVVPHGPLGYLTIWPTERTMPYVSTMNSPDGRIKANAAIVPAGAGGAVSVYATDTTDVILDIDGYFTSSSSETLQFYPLTPCRIVDTRNGQNGGTLQAGAERDYPMTGSCGIPGSAAAYSLNVTVLPAPGGLDYLTVWPQGEPRPVVSTLNDNTGTVVANAAIVPAGDNQSVAFYPNSNNTDLLVDVNGYFAAPGTGGYSYYSVPPCRAYDSRNGDGQPFQYERTVNIVNSPCAPPGNATAYVFNATVVPSPTLGYLTLWADGQTMPVVSTLNAYDGFITSNMAIVPNTDGSTDAYASDLTQLILDISGYFAP